MQFDSLEVLFIHSIRAPITDPIADDPPPKKLAIPCNRSWHGCRNVALYYSVWAGGQLLYCFAKMETFWSRQHGNGNEWSYPHLCCSNHRRWASVHERANSKLSLGGNCKTFTEATLKWFVVCCSLLRFLQLHSSKSSTSLITTTDSFCSVVWYIWFKATLYDALKYVTDSFIFQPMKGV